MRRFPWALACLLLLVFVSGRPVAQSSPQAAFHAIGDLDDGTPADGDSSQFSSQVRDAVRVGTTIYAVGGGSRLPCVPSQTCPSPLFTDTGLLWTFNGSSATLTALPNVLNNSVLPNPITASAITPDAAFIATRVRTLFGANTAVQAARFTRGGTNLVLPNFGGASSAVTISTDGSILYGNKGPAEPTDSLLSLARRYSIANGLVTSTPIPLAQGSPAPTTQIARTMIAPRGATPDGRFAVGWQNDTGLTPYRRAIRFDAASNVTAFIPLSPNAIRNQAVAVTPDGRRVLVGEATVTGSSDVIVYDMVNGATQRLGPPNSGAPGAVWTISQLADQLNPMYAGGISDDGSVVALSYGQFTGSPGNWGYAYFHNQFGWWHLSSALAAAAEHVDIAADGWRNLMISGMSGDATLVFGVGIHNGRNEGWVAEFAPGYLKNFNPYVAPTDTSLVGVWTDAPDNPEHFVVFMADGTYFHLEDATFERGFYGWNAGHLTFYTKTDTNGEAGFSDENGDLRLHAHISGDTLHDDDTGEVALTRITSPLNVLSGAFVFGDPTQEDQSGVLVVMPDGRFIMGEDGDPASQPGGHDGGEMGTLHWDPATGHITNVQITLDNNGEWGFSNNTGDQNVFITLSKDGLVAFLGDGESVDGTATRVVDPASVVPHITSALTATGIATVPLTYTITADRAVSFGAVNLPAGLGVDAATGVISGATAATGTFQVSIMATNSFGAQDVDTLSLTIEPPNTPVSPAAPVTVAPEVPSGGNPIAVTFSGVTAAGETTVAAIDPQAAPPPPANFSVGPVTYDVQTTAAVVFPATLCFNYAGAAGPVALFHFESGAWVNVTTSVDPTTQTVCGTTNSLSPFAVLVSTISRTGFYAPVSSQAAFVNTVKGGLTVPLKFNVYVAGVEKKTVDGLQFRVLNAVCDGAPEDPVDFTTSGSTSLRYDTTVGQFIQNWKVPSTAGACYVVQMTTTGDGLSLQAWFKVK